MNSFSYVFIILAGSAVLFLPRKWAILPFLMAACYITLGQVEKIGPFHFNIIRILVPFGLIRMFLRCEKAVGGLNRMDWLIIVWAIWALFSSAFHKDPEAALINRLGRSYDILGIYFMVRSFCQSEKEAKGLIKITALILAPVAIEMLNEQLTQHNLFSIFGGVSETPTFREGHFRSQGPFQHPILAGTVGAVCFPLMIGIWGKEPLIAKVGAFSCLIMIITSFSSGPWMSLILGVVGIIFWRWRYLRKYIPIAGILSYILLDLVMKAPAYYLIARIDLAGGSTGWHRSYLIESSLKHLNEWWLWGTDYTRHWMPTGVTWSPEHSDITNHYIQMGILGGLPLMGFFIFILWFGFRYISQIVSMEGKKINKINIDNFFIWTLGASLFTHVVTCIGVSYFDQSFLFLYLILAIISSLRQSIYKKELNFL